MRPAEPAELLADLRPLELRALRREDPLGESPGDLPRAAGITGGNRGLSAPAGGSSGVPGAGAMEVISVAPPCGLSSDLSDACLSCTSLSGGGEGAGS